MKRTLYFCIFMAFILLVVGSTFAEGLKAGTYRCPSYNVSGAGGSCSKMPLLVLKPDGTYKYSSTTGRWSIREGKLILSQSKLWGPGKILGQDTVRFEYDYNGRHHTVTWICQECGP